MKRQLFPSEIKYILANRNKMSESEFISNASKYNLDLDTLYKRDLNGIIERFKTYVKLYDIQERMNFNDPNYHNSNNRQYGETIHLAGHAAKRVLPFVENLKKNFKRNEYMNLKEYYNTFVGDIYSKRYPRFFNK